MYRFYQAYGLIIASESALPELPEVKAEMADICVQHHSSRAFLPSCTSWFAYYYLSDGKPLASYAKLDGGYLVSYYSLIDFFVDRRGREITCFSSPGVAPHTVRHLLLDHLIPTVVSLREKEAIHASAVLTPDGVVAFVGGSGFGKSTLAASFVHAGCSLLSDDCVVLEDRHEGFYAVPSYPGLRLWEPSVENLFGTHNDYVYVADYTQKRRIEVGRKLGYSKQPEPLTRLYILADSSEAQKKADIVIESPSPQESLIGMIRWAFRLDTTDHRMLARQLGFFGRMLVTVPVRRLFVPHDFRLLNAAREAILTDQKNPISSR